MDLQDLGCHVGIGQGHMLHATGVSDAIVPSVHFELEAALHREGFSRRVHLCRACGVGETKSESIYVNDFRTELLVGDLHTKKSCFRKKKLQKKKIQESAPLYPAHEKYCLSDTDKLCVIVFFCLPFEKTNPWPLKVKSKQVNSEGWTM